MATPITTAAERIAAYDAAERRAAAADKRFQETLPGFSDTTFSEEDIAQRGDEVIAAYAALGDVSAMLSVDERIIAQTDPADIAERARLARSSGIVL